MINPTHEIRNIYGYVRVSTPEQAKNGISIETQKKLIENFVKDKWNRKVTEIFVDEGVSGKVDIVERPGSRALTDVIDEWDIVVCTRLDRFSRSTSDLLNVIPVLQETGISLYFCEQFGDMPIVYPRDEKRAGLRSKFDMNYMANQIMLMVLSAVAEIEHGTIKERFAEGKIDWAEKGYSIGGKTPYGFKKVEEYHGSKRRVRLEPVEDEQRVIRTIHRLADRNLGSHRIARQVRSLHANARNMSPTKVARILRRKEQGLHYDYAS